MRGLAPARHAPAAAAWLCALAAWGCGSDIAGRAAAPPATPSDAATAPGIAPEPPTPPRGVPHGANIIDVHLDDRGEAAVSLDAEGHLRMWTRLDGSREPVPLPGSLAHVDLVHDPHGWRASGIDPAGSVHVLRIDDAGRSRDILATPPRPSALDAVLMGDGVVVLGADHVVRLMIGGETTSAFSDRGFRPTQLLRLGDRSVAAVAVTVDGDETSLELRRLAVRNGAWETVAEHEVTLPFTAGSQLTPVRISPTGSRLAIFGRTQIHPWQLATVVLATKETYVSDLSMASGLIPGGGFTNETTFVATEPTEWWEIDVTGEHHRRRARLTLPRGVPMSPLQIVSGVAVLGIGDHLMVSPTTTFEPRYLGYRPTGNQAVLSRSGTRIAWRTSNGQLQLVDVETGSTTSMPVTEGRVHSFAFYGDDRLVATYQMPERLVMFAADGTVIDRTNGSGRIQLQDDWLLLRESAQLMTVSRQGFQLVGLIGSAARDGQLVRTRDGWGLIVIASSNGKAHDVSIAQLAAGISRDDLDELPVATGYIPSLTDELGNTYTQVGARYARGAMGLPPDSPLRTVFDTPKNRGIALMPPSPHADEVALWSQGSLYVFDGKTGKRLWARANTRAALAWSGDGTRALVTGPLGYVVVDARTGRTLRRLCGVDFGASPVPPASGVTGGGSSGSICEDMSDNSG